MRIARITILNLLIALVIFVWRSLLYWDCRSEAPVDSIGLTSLEKQTGVEAHGLRISVNAVRRVERALEVSYVFRWVKCPEEQSPFGFMRPWGMLDVQFWDSLGNPMKESRQGDFV